MRQRQAWDGGAPLEGEGSAGSSPPQRNTASIGNSHARHIHQALATVLMLAFRSREARSDQFCDDRGAETMREHDRCRVAIGRLDEHLKRASLPGAEPGI